MSYKMVTAEGNIKSFDAYRLAHDVDTNRGQSGAGIVFHDNLSTISFGVHTTGGNGRNYGVRVTDDVINVIKGMRKKQLTHLKITDKDEENDAEEDSILASPSSSSSSSSSSSGLSDKSKSLEIRFESGPGSIKKIKANKLDGVNKISIYNPDTRKIKKWINVNKRFSAISSKIPLEVHYSKGKKKSPKGIEELEKLGKFNIKIIG